MDTHYAINIGRQICSGAREVAAIISSELGISVYDKKLLKSASDESGFSEEFFVKADEETSRRRLRSLFLTHLTDGGLSRNYMSNESMFKLQSDAIHRIHSQEDCIFIGRCANYILRDSDRILNLFLTATTEDRIRRICENNSGFNERKALRMLEDGDRKRAAYYNYYTGSRWGDSSSYDLCLSTSVFGVERCAEIIIDIARRKLGI